MVKCLKIGEINRFGERKDFDCIDYQTSEHRLKYNPNYNKNDYCMICKDFLNEAKESYESKSYIGKQPKSRVRTLRWRKKRVDTSKKRV